MVSNSSYRKLEAALNHEQADEIIDHEETSGPGVVFHVPESSKLQWNHIEDLDSFFTRMYYYHQNGGFLCMIIRELLDLFRFAFVVIFVTYLFHGIDYSILFKDKPSPTSGHKVSILDALLPIRECLQAIGLLTWICIFIAIAFWTLRLVKFFYNFVQFWDIKSFFNTALRIKDDDLDNLTWHDIQKKVREVQREQEMCVHKKELSELDIYHRILRFKNYMVAMINKSLLPVHLSFPIIGDVIFLTHGLKYNIEFLLFWGPWSPFENNWHLKEDFKKINKRQELARILSNHIFWVGIANFILCPVILLWQILYFSFSYGEVIKREPGTLSLRMWSLYGRLYLRHFNELDHELSARLNRAYRPTLKYMSMFTSPLLSLIADNVAFIFGSIFLVVFVLSCYDEDIITVQHYVVILTISGTVTNICRALVPDENIVWCPESLLTAVIAHIHYKPDSWHGQAHSKKTRSQVAQLFQYRAVHFLEELVSPLLTPFILCFRLRYKALDIVDFYRNFTIELAGVGDVCSFSQMNIKKHGNPMWQAVSESLDNVQQMETNLGFLKTKNADNTFQIASQNFQAEDGKTELSLLHFTITNPEWKPPLQERKFICSLKENVKKEATEKNITANPLFWSLSSLCELSPDYNSLISNLFRGDPTIQANVASTSNFPMRSGYQRIYGNRTFSVPIRLGARKAEGPISISGNGILQSLQEVTGIVDTNSQDPINSSLCVNIDNPKSEVNTVDMSLSTLYLHELHHRQVQISGFNEDEIKNSEYRDTRNLSEGHEQTPLLIQQNITSRGTRK